MEDNNSQNNDNLNKVLDIAKEEYSNYFQRIQALDVKVGLLMAFYGIIYTNVIDVKNLQQIFTEINVNKNITFSNVFSLHINILSIVLFIVTIMLLIYNLISKDTRFVPISIFSKEVTKYKEEELTSNLVEKTYKESIEKNNSILDKKHRIFNKSCILILMNLMLVLLNEFLKIG